MLARPSHNLTKRWQICERGAWTSHSTSHRHSEHGRRASAPPTHAPLPLYSHMPEFGHSESDNVCELNRM